MFARVRPLPFAAAALLLVACGGGSKSLSADDPLALFRAFEATRDVELRAAQGLLPLARGVAERIAADSGRDVAVRPVGSEATEAVLRVLIGRVDEPEIFALLEPLGVELEGTGFRFCDRSYDGANDALVVTVPDPERGGLPVRILAARRLDALLLSDSLVEPGWEPRFEVWRAGTPELVGRFEGGWPCEPVIEIDAGSVNVSYREQRNTIGNGELQLRFVPTQGAANRARGYLEAATNTKQRALAWAGVDPRTVTAAIEVHGTPGEMLARHGRVATSWVSPIGGSAQVLLAEGLPSDGGRAVAEIAARRALGPAAEPWLAEAHAVWASQNWWGRPLARWVGELTNRELALDVATLIGDEQGPFPSEHRLVPLRAFLFGWLVATRGGNAVRDLWEGRTPLDVDEALELGFATALEENRRRFPSLRPVEEEEEEEGAPPSDNLPFEITLPFQRGVHLVPERDPFSLLGAATAESLVELQGLGANAVALDVNAWITAEGPGADRPDAELILFAALAQRMRMATVLVPHLLVSPSGGLEAHTKRVGADGIDQFLARYEAFLTHYALVAELAQVPIMAVGLGLAQAVEVRAERPEAIHTDGEIGDAARSALDPTERAFAIREMETERAAADARRLRRAGWADLLARVERQYSGRLTYVAGEITERKKFDLWGQLHLFSSLFMLGLEGGEPEPDRVRHERQPSLEDLTAKLSAQLTRFGKDAIEANLEGMLFGVGFPAAADSWVDPSTRRGSVDTAATQLHATALAAALDRTLPKHEAIRGTFFWCWHVDPSRRFARPSGFDLRNGRTREQIAALLRAR
ncbi:MAG: hypothetical protein AAFZ65_05415 [Planctomycetota bacterium]